MEGKNAFKFQFKIHDKAKNALADKLPAKD